MISRLFTTRKKRLCIWKRYINKENSNLRVSRSVTSNLNFNRKIRKSEQASELFQQLLISKSSDVEKLKAIADELMNDYPSTPYASRAQIIYVKTYIKNIL